MQQSIASNSCWLSLTLSNSAALVPGFRVSLLSLSDRGEGDDIVWNWQDKIHDSMSFILVISSSRVIAKVNGSFRQCSGRELIGRLFSADYHWLWQPTWLGELQNEHRWAKNVTSRYAEIAEKTNAMSYLVLLKLLLILLLLLNYIILLKFNNFKLKHTCMMPQQNGWVIVYFMSKAKHHNLKDILIHPVCSWFKL